MKDYQMPSVLPEVPNETVGTISLGNRLLELLEENKRLKIDVARLTGEVAALKVDQEQRQKAREDCPGCWDSKCFHTCGR